MISDYLTRARILDVHVVDSGTFSTDTSNHEIVVPASKRYFVVGGHIDPDNSSTMTVRIKNVSDLQIGTLMSESAGTAIKFFCGWSATNNMSGGLTGGLCPLEEGDYIHFDFGSAQGAASIIFCRILVIDV